VAGIFTALLSQIRPEIQSYALGASSTPCKKLAEKLTSGQDRKTRAGIVNCIAMEVLCR